MTKQELIDSLRLNIFMAQNVACKESAARYLLQANKDADCIRKMIYKVV